MKPSIAKLIIVVLAVHLMSVDQVHAAQYTFVWTPRSQDVEGPGSASYRQLEALLSYVETQTYSLQSGDNLDFIIRKNFLVSAIYRNAYGLYKSRILDLNPTLAQSSYLIGTVITLPVGPKFAATELGDQQLTPKAQTSLFDSLTRAAYNSQTVASGLVVARRDLARYVNLNANGTSSGSLSNILVRGIVSATALLSKASSALALIQTYNLTIPPSEKDLGIARLNATGQSSLFPGFVPMDIAVTVPCSSCITCKDLLKIPPGTDISHARLLIEDTGANAAISSSNVVPRGTANFGDDSPDSHGTFVFSEISAPDATFPNSKGVLPSSQVFIAKAAHKMPDGTFQFAMKDMVDAWQAFAGMALSDSNAATTVVVNISAEGPPPGDSQLPAGTAPQLPGGDRVLVVAAAGNGNNDVAPINELFGELSTEHAALLMVGAVGSDGAIAAYSNWHPTHIQLFAQGNCVCGNPGQISGTSQAAPIVAVAAAVVASDRKEWNAHQVMWRLISSADAVPELGGKGLVGTINLQRALAHSISIVSKTQSSPLLASSVTFDGAWTAKILATQVSSDYPIIKLYDATDQADGQRCFQALMFQYFSTQLMCVPASASVSFVNGEGQAVSVKASDLVDITLPLPSDRDANISLPMITFLANGT